MWNLNLRLGKCLTDVSTILKNGAKLRIISEISKHFQKKMYLWLRRSYFRSKMLKYIWHFTRLFVTLHPK